eukprot:scaffold324_cov326-Pavlova_lutheri.AAC.12
MPPFRNVRVWSPVPSASHTGAHSFSAFPTLGAVLASLPAVARQMFLGELARLSAFHSLGTPVQQCCNASIQVSRDAVSTARRFHHGCLGSETDMNPTGNGFDWKRAWFRSGQTRSLGFGPRPARRETRSEFIDISAGDIDEKR